MGRGNAVMAAAVFCLFVVAFQSEVAHARTYTVGDAKGWTFGVQTWPRDKRFNAGDVLGLEHCSLIPSNAKVYTSGNDQITLVRGSNYFICSIGDHCDQGLCYDTDSRCAEPWPPLTTGEIPLYPLVDLQVCARIAISHPKGREMLKQLKAAYPDVVVADSPEKKDIKDCCI
ncbi:basic blue protein-like protein [Tanacetum coccineum]